MSSDMDKKSLVEQSDLGNETRGPESLPTGGSVEAPGQATPASPSMMGLASHALGGGFLQRKIQRRALQRRAEAQAAGEQGEASIHAAAERGVSDGGGSLPHLDTIQQSFGKHNVGGIHAHTGSAAAEASASIGAEAYATGNHVAFAGTPSLHTAAHEAAHVIQQRSGVSLKGGVGEEGDAHEQHADAVADAVVAGKSAEHLLDAHAGGGAGAHGVQMKADSCVVQKASAPTPMPAPAPIKQNVAEAPSFFQTLKAAIPYLEPFVKMIPVVGPAIDIIEGYYELYLAYEEWDPESAHFAASRAHFEAAGLGLVGGALAGRGKTAVAGMEGQLQKTILPKVQAGLGAALGKLAKSPLGKTDVAWKAINAAHDTLGNIGWVAEKTLGVLLGLLAKSAVATGQAVAPHH